MNAIKSKNRMKQLILTISVLLFLFAASDLYSQQTAGSGPKAMPGNGASITAPVSELAYDVLLSEAVKYDRSTLLSYSIPAEMLVAFKLYDKSGVELKTLVYENQKAGTHSIDIGSACPKDGVYFYKLTIGNYSEVKKVDVSY